MSSAWNHQILVFLNGKSSGDNGTNMPYLLTLLQNVLSYLVSQTDDGLYHAPVSLWHEAKVTSESIRWRFTS